MKLNYSLRNLQSASEYIVLSAAIILIWFLILYLTGDLGTISSTPLPSWRDGDMPAVLAEIKFFIENSSIYSGLMLNQFLNAPYAANWNDFPGIDLTGWMPSIFAKYFGLIMGVNLSILALQVFSGMSFYFVSNCLRYTRYWGAMGALIFAFAPLFYFRGIGHLTISTVWHLPLILLCLVWINNPTRVDLGPKFIKIVFFITCVLSAAFNIYYGMMFIFFLGINWVVRMVKGDRSSQSLALWLWLILVVEALIRFSYFHFRWLEGVNAGAVIRGLPALFVTSLTLPDLIYSPAHHSFPLDEYFNLAKNYYQFIPRTLISESQLSYIGLTAVTGLLLLSIKTALLVYEKKLSEISQWFWIGLGIFVYSISGGLNYLLGSFGSIFLLLRSNNRFSVFLMLIGVFYICELLSNKQFRKSHYIIAIFIAVFSIWDQVPSRISIHPYLSPTTINSTPEIKQFTNTLEEKLPTGAMVFQYPIHTFPESGTVAEMGDYDQFLPYLFSKNLHYSYGSMKGRADTRWQTALEDLSLKEQIAYLERLGFSAILIHKKAYEDEGKNFIRQIDQLGYTKILEIKDLAAFKLNPISNPIMPAPAWDLGPKDQFFLYRDGLDKISFFSKSFEDIFVIKRPWYLRMDPSLAQKDIDTPLRLSFHSNIQCKLWLGFNSDNVQEFELGGKQDVEVAYKPSPTEQNLLRFKTNCPMMKPTAKGDEINSVLITQWLN